MKEQLELNFDTTPKRRLPARRQPTSNADWWFSQIRRMVDCATEWSPVAAAKPCQSQLR